MRAAFAYHEHVPQFATINVVFANIVELLWELDECQGGRNPGVKVKTHGLSGRRWVVGIHVAVQHQNVWGVADEGRYSELCNQQWSHIQQSF